ncbi:MAG: hypothetical protein M9942_02095 [Microthrixaceae bacterium]|nr:hypothetical protein [Microthrixaceae bacterium]
MSKESSGGLSATLVLKDHRRVRAGDKSRAPTTFALSMSGTPSATVVAARRAEEDRGTRRVWWPGVVRIRDEWRDGQDDAHRNRPLVPEGFEAVVTLSHDEHSDRIVCTGFELRCTDLTRPVSRGAILEARMGRLIRLAHAVLSGTEDAPQDVLAEALAGVWSRRKGGRGWHTATAEELDLLQGSTARGARRSAGANTRTLAQRAYKAALDAGEQWVPAVREVIAAEEPGASLADGAIRKRVERWRRASPDDWPRPGGGRPARDES